MNKTIKTTTRSALIATALLMPSMSHAALFIDDFSSDTSANYTGDNTFGSGGGFTISSSTLNVVAAGGNTHAVFHNTAAFDIGDTVSVDITGRDTRLSVSTAVDGTAGRVVRFKWETGGTFKSEVYGGGSTTTYNSAFDVDSGTVNLLLTRETDNTFSAAFDSGSGITQLNTTGGTEKQIFTAGGTGNGSLFIGVEAFAGTRTFDNLTITAIPEPTTTALLGLGGLALILRRRK